MERQAEVDETGALALHVYRKCRDCPHDGVSELAPRIRNIANSLDDLDDHLVLHPLTSKYDSKLEELLQTTKRLLSQVQACIKEYSLLAASNRAPSSLSNDDQLSALKSDVGDVAIDIRLFYDQLTRSDEGRVAKALSSIIREGDAKRVTRLRQSVVGGFPDAWKLVQDDLEEKGVEKDTTSQCRPFVVEWVRKAEEEGRISPLEIQASQRQPSFTRSATNITPIDEREESGLLPEHTAASKDVSGKVLDPPRSESVVHVQIASSDSIPTPPTFTIEQHHVAEKPEAPNKIEDHGIINYNNIHSTSRGLSHEYDDLFGSTPTRALASHHSQVSLRPSAESIEHSPKTDDERAPHEIPLPASPPTKMTGVNRNVRTTPKNTAPSIYEKEVIDNPPRPPPKDPLPLITTRSSTFDSPSTATAETRPSPVEEGVTADLEQNAGLIANAFSVNNWVEANSSLELHIAAVENGAFAVVNGMPVQPDVKFLTFLQGVCLSYSGDFRSARDKFDFVLRRAHITAHGASLDRIDVAAARWLGQTLLMLHQSLDAALAWSLSLKGLSHLLQPGSSQLILLARDLRLLNDCTNALRILRTYGQERGRDLSKSLQSMPLSCKNQLVDAALDYCYSRASTQLANAAITIPSLVAVTISDLIMSKEQIPFEHDPLFRTESAISLLTAISRPKQNLNTKIIPTTSIGSSKSLFFKTHKSAQWLADTLREGLEAYTIEYKVIQTTYLVRLSVSHCRISYYACFAFRFCKVPLRPIYGVKLSDMLYATRSFENMGVLRKADAGVPDYRSMRSALMEQVKLFLIEREHANWQPGSGHTPLPDLGADARFELPAVEVMPPELMGSTQLPVELDSRGVWGRMIKRKPVVPAPPPNVFELEG